MRDILSEISRRLEASGFGWILGISNHRPDAISYHSAAFLCNHFGPNRQREPNMHKLILAFGTAGLLLSATNLQAQDYDADPVTGSKMRRTELGSSVRDEKPSPQFLRMQRAIKKSEERRLRIETNKWYGISKSRPIVGPARVNNWRMFSAPYIYYPTPY